MTEESKRNNIDIIKKAEALLLDYPEKELTHDDIGTISAALGIARVVISTYKNDGASDDSLQFWPKCRSCDSNMREHGEFSCKTCMFTSNGINHTPCNACTYEEPKWMQRNMYCPECGRPYTEEALMLLHRHLVKTEYTAKAMTEGNESMTPFQI